MNSECFITRHQILPRIVNSSWLRIRQCPGIMVAGKPYKLKYPPEDLFLLAKISSLARLLSSCSLKVEPPMSSGNIQDNMLHKYSTCNIKQAPRQSQLRRDCIRNKNHNTKLTKFSKPEDTSYFNQLCG